MRYTKRVDENRRRWDFQPTGKGKNERDHFIPWPAEDRPLKDIKKPWGW